MVYRFRSILENLIETFENISKIEGNVAVTSNTIQIITSKNN